MRLAHLELLNLVTITEGTTDEKDLNWLWHNKEWLFSGVGVAVVLVVCGFVRRHLLVNRHKASVEPLRESVTTSGSVTLTAGSVTLTAPNAAEILRELNARPPYQRAAAAESYKGLTVCWMATITTVVVEELGIKKRWRVLLHHHDPKDHSVTKGIGGIACHVDIEANPRLKIAHKGDVVIVRGTIDDASSKIVVLVRDATVEFV